MSEDRLGRLIVKVALLCVFRLFDQLTEKEKEAGLQEVKLLLSNREELEKFLSEIGILVVDVNPN